MTTITFILPFIMLACLIFIAIGFYFIGWHDGIEKGREGVE